MIDKGADDMERLRKLRKNRHLTQQQIAEFSGLNVQTYARIEKSNDNVDLHMLKRLAEILDVNPAYLAGFTDSRIDPLKTLTDADLTEAEQFEWKSKFLRDFEYRTSGLTRTFKNVYSGIPYGVPLKSISSKYINKDLPSIQIDTSEDPVNGETFFFKYLNGNLHPFIQIGDILFCQSTKEYENNDFLVVYINREDAIIKQVKIYKKHAYLVDPLINDVGIEIDNTVEIVGVVLRSHRIFKSVNQPNKLLEK